MGTTANSVLDERLHKLIGDWIEEDVTTALTTSAAVVSTNLNKFDHGRDDYFNGYWVYVTEYTNDSADRLIYDYATATGSCSVRGGNFTSDSSDLATCRFYKYSYTAGQRALKDAIREIYPDLYRPLEDRTMSTNNVLPDNSFELWIDSSDPSFYSATNATMGRTTTTGYIRGPINTTSMLVTASADSGYAYIDSNTYPRLLDLMNQDIDMAVWVMPSTAEDVFMDCVYTTDTGGSTTTSTETVTVASQFNLISRDNISIPDNIVKIEFRFRVNTSGQTGYFDSARVCGRPLREYLLLSDFADGEVRSVEVQTVGNQDAACDDLHPRYWDKIYGWETYSDGMYKWLRLPAFYTDNRQIRVTGTAPLSVPTEFADTVEIDGKAVDLLATYAAYCLFRNEEGVPSSKDASNYQSNAQKYLREYYRLLPSHRMIRPAGTMSLMRP